MSVSTRVRAVLGTLVLGIALAACSTATPDTASVGIDYTGGAWDSQQFNKCIDPGHRDFTDLGGTTYYYPVGTRTWDFSTRPGADSPPIAVSTSNNQELIVSGTITFNLVTDCAKYTDGNGREWPGGKLQKFHDTIGRAKGAFWTSDDSTQVPQGWKDTLGLFLGGPANRAMDQVGGGVTWQNLYSDKATVDSFTKQVAAAIPGLLKQQTGGEEFFTITAIQLDKPDVPGVLKDQLQAKEAAILAQQTADQQLTFAKNFPGGLPGYQAYLEQQARTKCYNDGKCIYVPNGVSVPVAGG
jgi:hypothetical protein